MLYHGSKTPGIRTLKPFPHNGVDGQSVVFATSDKRFALAMMYGTGNELAVGYFIDPKTKEERMYIDELEIGKLELLNTSGTLYEIEESGFNFYPQLEHTELVSLTEVAVVNEMYIENILEELKRAELLDIVPYDKVLEAMKERGQNPNGPDVKHVVDRFE